MRAIYIESINLMNVKIFQGEYSIKLTDASGKPCQWTVLLGNNNTGKTTFLRAVSELQVVPLDLNKLTTKREHFVESNIHYVPQASSWHKQSPINPTTSIGLSQEISTKLQESMFDSRLRLNTQFFVKIEHNVWYSKRDEKGKGSITVDSDGSFSNFIMYGYGAIRRKSDGNLNDDQQEQTAASLFSEHVTLLNVEDWILRTYIATTSQDKEVRALAAKRLSMINELFVSELFEDIQSYQVITNEQLNSYVAFEVHGQWVPLKSLGYGYQNSIAWLVDLAKRMFDRYFDLENPLHGPAIVLVDEIDLHLHPEWQRKIIRYLGDLFLNTQFIVTAHSPLIVQSAENVNLIMLEKDDETGSINVRQQFGSFQGWTIEEILRELMDMGEKTRSDRYLELMRQFEDGLLTENYASVKSAYEELDKILSPTSHQRKVLQIQMSSLIPA